MYYVNSRSFLLFYSAYNIKIHSNGCSAERNLKFTIYWFLWKTIFIMTICTEEIAIEIIYIIYFSPVSGGYNDHHS